MSHNPKRKLYISPPFGNYLFWLPNTTSIMGSFTLERRPGLLGQIYRTLYYDKKLSGWVNKIGLRNPGIAHIIDRMKNSIFSGFYKDDVVSIAIKDVNEIEKFNEIIPEDTKLEINVSCPNVDKKLVNEGIAVFINDKRSHCSLKLSPLTEYSEIDEYYRMGFRTFHFSNTLPVPNGGLSGPSLIPYTSKLIKYTRDNYEDTEIIAGGGIRDIETLNMYEKLGANHFSVSTLCFNPLLFFVFYLQINLRS